MLESLLLLRNLIIGKKLSFDISNDFLAHLISIILSHHVHICEFVAELGNLDSWWLQFLLFQLHQVEISTLIPLVKDVALEKRGKLELPSLFHFQLALGLHHIIRSCVRGSGSLVASAKRL